jgi:ABC-2 type transport system permease protein
VTAVFLRQLRYEQLVFWRSREAAIFVYLLPILLFLLLGAVYGDEVDGRPAASYLLAGMLGYGVANTAFGGLAIFLVLRRENGILKRIRATPIPAPVYLASVLVSTFVVFAIQSATLVLVGWGLYDAELPERWGSLLLALAIGAAAFAGLGLGATAVIRSAEGASPIVNVVILPMAFLSGSFGPEEDYPAVLEAIGKMLPLKHFLDLVGAVYLDGEAVWSQGGAIAVVAAWGAAGLAVAARWFRWDPQSR